MKMTRTLRYHYINKTVVEKKKYMCQYSAVIARVIKTRCGCQQPIQMRCKITQEGDYKVTSDTCILIIYTSQEQ